MSMLGGNKLVDKNIVVHAFGPNSVSSASPRYISLKDVRSVDIVITALNTTGVTGSAVTINQATAVAGTSAKALSFTKYYTVTNSNSTVVAAEATAASNTFTTANTNNATLVYRIPVDPSTLDVANGFDCIQVGLANATNTTVAAHYLIEPKVGGNYATMPNVGAD